MTTTPELLFEIEGLSKFFLLDNHNTLKAVRDLSLTIAKGETVGIVGESGCGKTTLGRTLKRLYTATAGTARYKGQDIFRMDRAQAHRYAKEVQMIFQDPYSSLDPRMTVREIIREGMRNHGILRGTAPARTGGSASCWGWWGWGRSTPTGSPTSFPAASGSASASPALWRWSRR